MRKYSTSSISVIVLTVLLAYPLLSPAQEVYYGSAARSLFEDAELVRESRFSTLPSYLKFRSGTELNFSDFNQWITKNYKIDNSLTSSLLKVEVDQLGHKHYRYQQSFKGIPIENALYNVHTKNGKIYSINGTIYKTFKGSTAAVITPEAGFELAKEHIGATVYKWEMPAEEAHLKREQGDESATYYPEAQLMYILDFPYSPDKSHTLSYEYDIYAHNPMKRSSVFVNSMTGEISKEREITHTADEIGTANTAYSGTQTITADSFAGGYRLNDASRGSGVNTYDMNTGTDYGSAEDFEHSDNTWDTINVELDEYAHDAHWGAEQTYDFYLNELGRNSIDDAGFALNSYIHYGVEFSNAFWDGNRMTYGDGEPGTFTPLTSIDVCGHEVTHGLVEYTANLEYFAESGALNESFADIFGTAIEYYARPTAWDWFIGADFGDPFRSMDDPKSKGDPDTYFGINWADLAGPDAGGVHTNSGVQNHWYYLLVEGGSGTNDNSDTYDVTAVGWDIANAVAYRNLSVYLTQFSEYEDARFYAITSAIDLYGGCSPEVQSVTNAWHAVGVGAAYQPSVQADFESPNPFQCLAPTTVQFDNLSSNGTSFEWDFGDGETSTDFSPDHTYDTLGVYDVTLIADGGACGTDTTTKIGFVNLDSNGYCEITMPAGFGHYVNACEGTLYDPGGPIENYPSNSYSDLRIVSIGAEYITLVIEDFDIWMALPSQCTNDWLAIYDGPNDTYPLIGEYCNASPPPDTIVTTAADVFIKFNSFVGPGGEGFRMIWFCEINEPVLSQAPVDFPFSLHPNPTTDFVHVYTGGSTDGWYVIRDVLGRYITVETYDKAAFDIDFSTLSAGTYVVKITTEEGEVLTTQKIVKN